MAGGLNDRPLVVVTAPLIRAGMGRPATVLEEGYGRGVMLAGGLPVIVSPALETERALELLGLADGLLLSGGEDVDPGRYGEGVEGAEDLSPERDELEFALLARALERGLPVFAICRGMQLLNVALGGTLWQDLVSQRPGEVKHRGSGGETADHPVRFRDARLLAGVAPAGRARVNSTHHQGIRELGRDLVPVARTEDELVEAVELRVSGGPWVAGVQWHPERGLDREPGTDRRLFERFGEALRGEAGPRAVAATG